MHSCARAWVIYKYIYNGKDVKMKALNAMLRARVKKRKWKNKVRYLLLLTYLEIIKLQVLCKLNTLMNKRNGCNLIAPSL